MNLNRLIHTRGMSAAIMLLLTTIPVNLAQNHVWIPTADDTVLAMEAPATIPTDSKERSSNVVETTKAKEPYIPTPGELNLAYYFPEGADQTEITESYGGRAFKELMSHDDQWIGQIYDTADASPLQMATSLGKKKSKIMGKYNPKDEKHDIKNSDTWTINSFKKVRMTFTDGDGKAVSAYSNVIDIMSMANLYTYFKGVEDYDLFLSYAQNLWDKSHSYTVNISDIYYCSGCLSENAEQLELAELEAEARAEEAATQTKASETETAEGEAGTKPTEPATQAASVIVAGTKAAVETTTAAPETTPESTSGVIISGTTAAAETSPSILEESYPSTTLEQETNAEVLMASPSEITESASVANATPGAALCPGHVDLIVNAKVIGIKEEHGLFEKDTIGNNPENIEENGWPGWADNTRASARLLASQDWFDRYGLTLSLLSIGTPLTESEIESYLNQLPEETSQTRKDVISFALSSVGRVPYYWGGKPSAPDYNGNSFGLLTAPDEKGRVLKGLDCSGWIGWVYWSATGKRLAYEGTSGLAVSGTKVRRSELQPGDIIVRTGSDAHVIMFLGWTPDGKIQCVHESSAGVNNVTVAIRDANWPYYRKLID